MQWWTIYMIKYYTKDISDNNNIFDRNILKKKKRKNQDKEVDISQSQLII